MMFIKLMEACGHKVVVIAHIKPKDVNIQQIITVGLIATTEPQSKCGNIKIRGENNKSIFSVISPQNCSLLLNLKYSHSLFFCTHRCYNISDE